MLDKDATVRPSATDILTLMKTYKIEMAPLEVKGDIISTECDKPEEGTSEDDGFDFLADTCQELKANKEEEAI